MVCQGSQVSLQSHASLGGQGFERSDLSFLMVKEIHSTNAQKQSLLQHIISGSGTILQAATKQECLPNIQFLTNILH